MRLKSYTYVPQSVPSIISSANATFSSSFLISNKTAIRSHVYSITKVYSADAGQRPRSERNQVIAAMYPYAIRLNHHTCVGHTCVEINVIPIHSFHSFTCGLVITK